MARVLASAAAAAGTASSDDAGDSARLAYVPHHETSAVTMASDCAVADTMADDE